MTMLSPLTERAVSRRRLLGGALAAAALGPLCAKAAPRPGFDGLYEEPWLFKSSSDLSKDLAEAAKAKKQFMIIWEARGCPWCKLLHTENFARPDIANYIQENFSVLQLNLTGSREIADFDGEKAPELVLAMKYGVNSTPTIQFFRASDAARGQELGRIGYLKPDDFLLMMRFVREKGYEDGPFEAWAKAHGKTG